MNTIFLIIVVFLLLTAVMDLFVGVSNDAVNFTNSAVGSKAARFRTVMVVAAVGVFAGAAISNGMIDIARHGIMAPTYFTFYDVMCVFLAVMITDILLLDLFNSLGLPTSTTVSMVFELLGGAFAMALVKVAHGTVGPDGVVLGFGDYLNTAKALSVIVGIFMSVAIAFVLGSIIQWFVRLLFTFTYKSHAKLKTAIYGGISFTIIIWFLLVNGLKNSAFMTDDLKALISDNTWTILVGGTVVFSLLMGLLQALKVNVLKLVVLMGTFALAMAFAGNDLVNFVGVPLTALESYADYAAHGSGDPHSFFMTSLNGSAQTPTIFLIAAGAVMVFSLFFSKKAHAVTKTEVGLSSRMEGDEMFGSSAVARTLVRMCTRMATAVHKYIPASVGRWVDSRFNKDEYVAEPGAAYDLVRASVNLVISGLLVTLGTSLKLPLSTTYVTFTVAMGAALADRAWSRESAVFRITGIFSVIGGWFITAGIAFAVCFVFTNILFFCGYVAMIALVLLGVVVLVLNNRRFARRQEKQKEDETFVEMTKTNDRDLAWQLLQKHVRNTSISGLEYIINTYRSITDGFFNEKYSVLRKAVASLRDERDNLKRMRRREIVGLRKIDPSIAIERNTWFFLQNNSLRQMLYCLKRTADPCREHVGNNFSPLPKRYIDTLTDLRERVLEQLENALSLMRSGKSDGELVAAAEQLRTSAEHLQQTISKERKALLDDLNAPGTKIEPMIVSVNILQESQEILGNLRHMLRGMSNLQA